MRIGPAASASPEADFPGLVRETPAALYARMDEMEIRRRKLRFRAARRGFREVDAIFGAFVDRHLRELDGDALDLFEMLLDVPDREVYSWLTGEAPVPKLHDTSVFARLKAVCNRKNPSWTV